MGYVRRLLFLLPLFAVLTARAQVPIVYTHITLNSMLGVTAGNTAQLCATPADQYGNPISFSSNGVGFVKKGALFCGSVVNGALTASLGVPNACVTNNANPIFYNFTIQELDGSGDPSGPPVVINAVPNVCGVAYALDTYAPVAATSTPLSPPLAQGSGVPTQCTAPSIWINNDTTSAYTCKGGTYALISLAGSAGPAGPPGTAGVASLTSLSALRLAALAQVSNFLDPARVQNGYFVDANSGSLVALAGHAASGMIVANSGGQMVSNVDIPAYAVSNAAPGSSTANQLDYTQMSGPANGQLVDATTGALFGSFNGYGSSGFVYVFGASQMTTNAPFFNNYQNSGVAFYDANKVFLSGSVSYPNGASDFHAETITIPAGAYWCRFSVQYYNTDPTFFGPGSTQPPSNAGGGLMAVLGPTLPSAFVAFTANTGTTTANGIAEYDQNGTYLRGIAGDVPAGTPFTLGSDVAEIRIGFSATPTAVPEVLNGATVPSSPVAFVGAAAVAQASAPSAPTLLQLWPAMANNDWWLAMTETSGGTIHDVTGNGHDAPIAGSGTAAVWTGNVGIQLDGQAAMIPNAAGRASFGLCADFPAGGTPGNYGYLYSLASGPQNGYNLGTSYGPGGVYHGALAYYPQIGRSNGGPSSTGGDGFSGHHCVEAVAGKGAIVVDGREISSYVYEGGADAIGGGQLTNAMYLNPGNGSQTGLPITIYSAWAGNDSTVAQAAAKTASEVTRLKQAGVYFGSPTSQATDNTCAVDGTSIDQGFQAGNVRPITLVNFTVPCTVSDYSMSGQGPTDMATGFDARAALSVHPNAARNTAYFGGVTNGLINFNETPAQALADTVAWNRKAHAAGYKTIVSTMMSRCGNNQAGTSSGDTLAQAYNALLLAVADEFDWLDNLAAWPALGATNACANTTYFADGTHITSSGGQPLYVQNEQTAFNGVYRNPASRFMTATTAQLPSDTIVTANCASACTLSLLDANSVSFNKAGRLAVHNLGAGVLTVAPISGETINGAATVAVPAGSSLQIVPYVASAAVGGANWISVAP